jgi:hypothetical protein
MRPIIFALIVTLALAVPAAADYVHMYVDGPLGGQIVVDDAGDPPPGTCGARFPNPDSWYWADGYYGETGELEVEDNGAATNSLRLTGAFTGCPQVAYDADTPANQNGHVPPGAISLVVEIDLAAIEWLDSSGIVVVGPPPPPPPPLGQDSVFDPCKIPGFCEELIIGYHICDLYPASCESDGILVRIADLTASIPAQTANARKQLAAGRRKDAGSSLALARSRAGLVIGQLGELRARQVQIDRVVANSYPSIGAAISLGNHSAGYEFGIRHTASCDQSLNLAQKALAAGRTPDWAAVDAACLQATEPLSHSRTWLGRLQAWSLRAR